MKKLILFSTLFLCAAGTSGGQILDETSIQPVSWNYNAIQVKGNTYELHLTASIQPRWHIYAQQQPDNAIAMTTTIQFMDDSLITFERLPKEKGNKVRCYNKFWEYLIGNMKVQLTSFES
jgi:hypothetical protein